MLSSAVDTRRGGVWSPLLPYNLENIKIDLSFIQYLGSTLRVGDEVYKIYTRSVLQEGKRWRHVLTSLEFI